MCDTRCPGVLQVPFCLIGFGCFEPCVLQVPFNLIDVGCFEPCVFQVQFHLIGFGRFEPCVLQLPFNLIDVGCFELCVLQVPFYLIGFELSLDIGLQLFSKVFRNSRQSTSTYLNSILHLPLKEEIIYTINDRCALKHGLGLLQEIAKRRDSNHLVA